MNFHKSFHGFRISAVIKTCLGKFWWNIIFHKCELLKLLANQFLCSTNHLKKHELLKLLANQCIFQKNHLLIGLKMWIPNQVKSSLFFFRLMLIFSKWQTLQELSKSEIIVYLSTTCAKIGTGRFYKMKGKKYVYLILICWCHVHAIVI